MAKRVRDYKRERVLAIRRGETGTGKKDSSGKSISGDSVRHRARRKVEKRLGRKLDTDQHVDHKNPLKNGGSNGESNLRVRSKDSNSAHGGKIGDRKKKGNRYGKLKGALSK